MSVLQRKAQVGKQEHQARAMTVPKSLRIGLARFADDTFGMALVVIGLTQETRSGDTLSEILDDSTLMLLMDGPTGLAGGATLDGALVTALVQQQTMGRVTRIEGFERGMTETDAALCAPLIEGLLARANTLLEEEEDRDLIARFRFGAKAENARLFDLALDAAEYSILRLTVDVAGGKVQSNIVLILPLPEPRCASHQPAGDETQERAKAPTMEKPAMSLQAELSAVLCRIRLPLAQVSSFSTGTVLPVPSEAFDDMELTAIDGRVVTKGVMGQVEGKRALQIKGIEPLATYPDTSNEDGPSDYANLELPALDLPQDLAPIDPSNLDSLPEIPDLPDLPDPDQSPADPASALSEQPALPDLPDLDVLPDFGDLADPNGQGLPHLPDVDTVLPEAGDLPKFDVA